jgi:hypothetical protein
VLRLPAPLTVGATFDIVCFNCGRTGHFSRECTTPRKNIARDHLNHPPRGQQKVVATRAGRVKYITMEDIPEGGQVITGMFSLNGYPVIILFYSGATHNFISKVCTHKCQLIIEHINTPYMIRTPGGNVTTKQLVMATPLNFVGRIYKTNLIVLNGQGIDVILEMGWMKGHNALLDIVARTVHLEPPVHGNSVL